MPARLRGATGTRSHSDSAVSTTSGHAPGHHWRNPGYGGGDPDGFGTFGQLDEDDDGVLCHECGARVASLGNHAYSAHQTTAREYKFAHGLPLSRSLTSRATRQRRSARAQTQVGTPGWRRLEQARDPAAASAARDPQIMARAARQIRAAAVAVENGRKARRPLVLQCPICGVTWCPLPSSGRRRQFTCGGSGCLATYRAVLARRPGRRNPARDTQIVAAVVLEREHPDVVAARYGITATRVRQIVGQALR